MHNWASYNFMDLSFSESAYDEYEWYHAVNPSISNHSRVNFQKISVWRGVSNELNDREYIVHNPVAVFSSSLLFF